METFLSELVKAIKSNKSSSDQIDLPIFRPEQTDAKKWIIHLERIKSELEWTDQELLLRLGRSLTAVSKIWFETWTPDVRTWDVFQRDFLEAFPPKKNLGQLLSDAALFNSDRCNTYDAYVYEKIALLRNLRALWEEADLVELIIHGIQEQDIRTNASNHNFKKITELISFLSSINETFSWTEEQEAAKNYVIECLVSKPLLLVFDTELPTELHTDASAIGYGAVLLQKRDGNPRIIGYFSKRTSQTESRYHSYELETLAVVNALKHFRVYLLGIQFTLITDCNAIKSTATKKDLLPRVARWWSYMQDFNFTIQYRKGSSLPHVDYLSRNPIAVRRVAANHNWLYIEQRGDAEIRQLIKDSEEGRLDANRYIVRDGVLHYKVTPMGPVTKPFVPRQSRLGLLRIFHDEQCHVGTDKTIDSIQKHFWFPRLRQFVKNYIKHCLVCAVKKTRTGPLQGFITNSEKPTEPMHVLHADCLGPLLTTPDGNKHVLVLIDGFTKYCVLQPLKTVKADETKLALQTFISLFGTPKCIVMDAGTNFKNLSLPEYLDSLGISYHYITPDIHRSNGQVERYMRTIMNLLRIETSLKSEWSSGLWKIQLVLNTTVHKATQTSPLKALLGIEGATPLIQNLLKNLSNDLHPLRNLKLDRERIRERLQVEAGKQLNINQKRRDLVQFQIGDFVLMHRDDKMHQSKLKYEFQGPFEVVGITPQGRFELRRVGKTIVTKAAKEQLRHWPNDWSLSMSIPDLLDQLENDSWETDSSASLAEEPSHQIPDALRERS